MPKQRKLTPPRHSSVLAGVLALGLLTACQTTKDPSGPLDTPHNAVQQGMSALGEGDLARADARFAHALELDPKYLPAYEGQARLALETDRHERGFAALDAADALVSHKPEAGWPLKRLRMRLLTDRAEPGFFDDVEDVYEEEVARDWRVQNDPTFLILVGEAALAAYARTPEGGLLDDAEHYLKLAAAKDGKAAADADRLVAKVDTLRRAALASAGDDADISAKPAITRLDLARLLAEDVDLEAWFQGKVNLRQARAGETGAEGISDYGHLAQADAVRLVHRAGFRALSARNGLFRPDAPVTREELALVLEDMLIKRSGDTGLGRRYFGAASPFGDVAPSRPTFNAIMVAISRQFMSADTQGAFHPTDPASGADALLAVRALRTVGS